MRVTNNMILRNSSYNINGTKGLVDNTSTQMTTQKKISRPSEDPVVAIRSLRLSTSLNKVNQYYEKNIPDAKSWLEVTETALTNMKTLMTDVRTQVVNGATDTLTQDDRNTILTQLKLLQSQLFAEGNADYAGRTVFTGFRTDKELVFSDNEKDTLYEIKQDFSYEQLESFNYYTGNVEVPNSKAELTAGIPSDTQKTNFYRLRSSYDNVDEMNEFSYSYGDKEALFEKQSDGSFASKVRTYAADGTYTETAGTGSFTVFENEQEWADTNAGKEVGDSDIIFIKETGHFVFGKDVAAEIQTNKATVHTDYDRKGFEKGELRPEYYFNCTNKSDPLNPISYDKYDADGNEIGYDIDYNISANQTLTVNLEASDAFNSDIQRDIDDMLNCVNRAMSAHDKIAKIKSMMAETQYDNDDDQAKLKSYYDAAQKEADYADDYLQKLFSAELGKIDSYLENVNLAIAKVGCTVDQLLLTESRMSNQQETIQDLQSQNDDLELSEIIIKYTAAYNAYQSSLTAAGKLSGQTLLNYI